MKNKNKFNNEVEYLGGSAWYAEPKIPIRHLPKRHIGYQNNLYTSRLGIFILLVWLIIGLIWIKNIKNDINSHVEIETIKLSPILSESKGIVSAYNLVSWQTDLDYCTGAYGDNICQLLENGIKVIANNCLPKNTEVEIEGLGRFVVLDRMNSRYGCEYFDIAMPGDKVIEAIQFGRQEYNVIIYE